PMLVVAFAIAGRVDIDLTTEALCQDHNGKDVFLKDIWPSDEEIHEVMRKVLSPNDFQKNYDEIFEGNEIWRNLKVPDDKIYKWDENSTYIKEVPFFRDLSPEPKKATNIEGARALLVLGDSITTDHISPAGAFAEDSAGVKYVNTRGLGRKDRKSYGSGSGNYEVLVRGTFANLRINIHLAEKEGSYTTYLLSGEELTAYEACQKYIKNKSPLIVLTGKEYA